MLFFFLSRKTYRDSKEDRGADMRGGAVLGHVLLRGGILLSEAAVYLSQIMLR